jgi:hypothetical protein
MHPHDDAAGITLKRLILFCQVLLNHVDEIRQHLGQIWNVHAYQLGHDPVHDGKYDRRSDCETEPSGDAGEKVQPEDFSSVLGQSDELRDAAVVDAFEKTLYSVDFFFFFFVLFVRFAHLSISKRLASVSSFRKL